MSCFMTDIIFMSSERLISGVYNKDKQMLMSQVVKTLRKIKKKLKKKTLNKKEYVFIDTICHIYIQT